MATPQCKKAIYNCDFPHYVLRECAVAVVSKT